MPELGRPCDLTVEDVETDGEGKIGRMDAVEEVVGASDGGEGMRAEPQFPEQSVLRHE